MIYLTETIRTQTYDLLLLIVQDMKKKAAIPLTKNSIYSRDNAVYDTAEDSESDDADMELLVKKALNGLKSTLGPTSKSFNQINERLLSAGRATSRNLSTKKGLIVETNWKKGIFLD